VINHGNSQDSFVTSEIRLRRDLSTPVHRSMGSGKQRVSQRGNSGQKCGLFQGLEVCCRVEIGMLL
jgi:hypothetical protein